MKKPMRIRWNPGRAEEKWRKHHVTFFEAEMVFHDPLMQSLNDVIHSDSEDRFSGIGMSRSGRLVVVTYTVRDDEAWLINARRALPMERRRYMEGEDWIREEPPIDTSDIPETDFTNAVRGLHYIPMTVTRVSIADDVAEVFRTDDDVNDALRLLINEGRVPPYRY